MMHPLKTTLLLLLLGVFIPVGCGIDTNPFPQSDERSPTDVAEQGAAGEFDGDGATNAGGQNDGGDDANAPDASDTADPSAPEDGSTCDTGAQSLAPYTIFHAYGKRVLVGDVASVVASSAISIADQSNSELTRTTAADNGSFALQHDEPLPGSIWVSSVSEAGISAAIQVGLMDATTAAHAATAQVRNAWLESGFAAESGLGMYQAGDTFEFTGNEGTLLPGLSVVVANLTQGNAMAVKVSDAGGFTAWVQAEGGDDIVIFCVEHGSSNGGGTPLFLEAP